MFVVKTVFFSISYLNMCFGIKNKWFSHFNMSRARERCGVAVEKRCKSYFVTLWPFTLLSA